MLVRIITVTLFIPAALTLKDKRQIIQSLSVRLRKLNLAVAEVGFQDQWQRAQLGLAMISNQTSHLDRIQDEIISLINDYYQVEITDLNVTNY